MALRKMIDFTEWLDTFNNFWTTYNYSDSFSLSDEARFTRSGCDCCAYIARANGLAPLAGDVYECKDIHGNTFELCGNCLSTAVNNDSSWFDYYADSDGFIHI